MNKKTIILGVVSGSAVTYSIYKWQKAPENKRKVVVLGGGYAGRSFVKSIDKDQYDVVLIDKSLHKTEKKLFFDRFRVNALTYQPQPNYVDSISENAVVNQFMLLSDAVTTIKGECVNVNEKEKKITLKSDEVLDYDYLVFATGSIPDTNHISMKYSCANSLWYFFKDRGDLETLMTVFNIIGLEDVVIMGGGITGVELASELSKRILDAGGRKSPRVTACEGEALKTVTIIEPGDRLLPKLKESTSKIVTEHLAKQKVEILTNAVIKGAEDGFLRVKVSGQEVKFKATIAVWTCGVKSDELAMRCVGHNNVTGTLALPSGTSAADGDSNIFAIGDCNNLLPKSAQNAKQQGAYLASYFNSGFKQSTPQFEFNSQGTMIRLADRIYMDSPVYQGFLPLWVHRVIIGLDI